MLNSRLNQEQQEAVNTLDKNIIVAASAGTGKTTTLVERIIKRVAMDKVSIDHIVAITFTNAAAAEMKKRLTQRIIEISEKYPSDYLKQQQYLISTADISTIHSFCLKIIKNYYYAIELDPVLTTNIFDELELSLIKDQAFNYLYETKVLSDPLKYEALLNSLSNRPLDKNTLKETILALANTAILQIDPKTWLKNSLNDFNADGSFQQLTKTSENAWWNYLQFQVAILKQIIENIKVYLEENSLYDDSEITYYQNHQLSFDRLETACQMRNYQSFQSEIEKLTTIKKVASFKDESKSREDYQKKLKEIWANLYPENTIMSDLRNQKPIMTNLVELTLDYLEKFKQLKLEAQGLDFNDLERFAYQILIANNYEVAHELKNHYQEILVDEFQDTNHLQNSIVDLISQGNNVFRVGDVKQAIYRFRGGNPTIMQELIVKGQTDENYQVIYLRHNYRSKINIINFTNDTFNHLMNLNYYDNYYLEADQVASGIPQQEENSSPVIFKYLNYDKEIKIGLNRAKAEFIASEIIKLVAAGAKYSDIVVLLRGHSQKKALRQVFEKNNIPSHILLKDGFVEAPGILTVMAVLNYLINPKDEISFVAILKNLFSFSNNQLAEIKLAKNELSFVEYLNSINHPVIAILNNLKSINPYHLTDILNQIYQIENYYQDKCDKEQRTNLDLLYDKAILYQANSVHIHSFYNLLLSLELSDVSEGSTIGIDDNVVRVMTIHQAKGLEFPIVFFWSVSRPPRNNSKTPLVVSDKLGFALKTTLLPEFQQRFNLKHTLISFNNTLEDLAEEIRILYVALTRAERELYIVEANPYQLPTGFLSATDIFLNKTSTYWLYILAKLDPKKHFQLKLYETYQLTPQEPLKSLPVITEKYLQPITKAQIIRPSETEGFINDTLNFETDPFAYGTKIHNLVEIIPNQVLSAEELLQYDATLTENDLEKVLNLINSEFYQELIKYPIDKELPFVYKDKNNNIINGFIDFVAWKESSPIIVDFKTDRVASPKELIRRYEKQLLYYKEALSAIYPNYNFETYIYSFALNQFIAIKN